MDRVERREPPWVLASLQPRDPEPREGASFRDNGWAVLNEPEDDQVVFACQDRFEKEMNSHNPKIKCEG